MSLLKDLADAIVTELNEASFTSPFYAERVLSPRQEAKDLGSLSVVVFPIGTNRTRLTRNQDQLKPVVNIAVSQVVIDDDEELTDRLMTTVEEIEAWVLGRNFEVDGTRFGCMEVSSEIFDPKMINESGVFQGLVTATLTGVRNG